MPYISVNVDLDEVYDELSTGDKKDLVEWLSDDGFIDTTITPENSGLTNDAFNEMCSKLANAYYRMSKEDEEIIINMVKKYS
jgi:hypothetical protein